MGSESHSAPFALALPTPSCTSCLPTSISLQAEVHVTILVSPHGVLWQLSQQTTAEALARHEVLEVRVDVGAAWGTPHSPEPLQTGRGFRQVREPSKVPPPLLVSVAPTAKPMARPALAQENKAGRLLRVTYRDAPLGLNAQLRNSKAPRQLASDSKWPKRGEEHDAKARWRARREEKGDSTQTARLLSLGVSVCKEEDAAETAQTQGLVLLGPPFAVTLAELQSRHLRNGTRFASQALCPADSGRAGHGTRGDGKEGGVVTAERDRGPRQFDHL
ncbi:hypothetical protein TREES_T100014081 [Tupaia chinensis]|uniref:Uncharacterized protein n=1 Tax=Tupaia chinensis TaxID=246437 RepID=L9KKL7_TUPCH|nr:hypothetical protein TREES_T100014081 [Tupaia chinensis]